MATIVKILTTNKLRWFTIILLFPQFAFSAGTLEIDEPLTNGTASGDVHGGVFTENGWKTQTREDYIQYDIATCSYGKIEFDVVGLYASNEVFQNIGYNKSGEEQEDVHYTLFNMWDRDDSNLWYGQTMPSGVKQWHNPYKCSLHLFGYVQGDVYKWKHGRFRLNVSAYEGGYEDDPHAFEVEYGPVDWQKDHVYHVELDWGQGAMSYYIDGELQVKCDYSSFGEEYAPPDHSLRIGSAIGCKGLSFQVPRFITYSNFKFYRFEDHTPPAITDFSPADGTSDAEVNPYIAVVFNESIDLNSAKAAFSISPSVPGELKSAGSSIYYEPDGLLDPLTTYTVNLTTELTDKSGNHLQSPLQFQFTTKTAIPVTVGRYQIFDLPIVAPDISGNKYKDVTLHGVFRGPTKTIEIDGFWDGGNIWRVRMAPTEIGQWQYTITSSRSELNTSGSFECVASDSKGFIHKNPDHPYTFMYDDGTPWMWKGETSWRATTSVIPFEARWKPYIDLRASQGYDAVQFILVSYINGDAFWKNEGGPVFELTSDGKDYDHLNPAYFKWVDKRLDYALSKGVVPVMLFTWAQEFAKFSTEQFEKYEKYLVARYAAYNIFWVLCGEYDEVYEDYGMSSEVWKDHGELVYRSDPYKHPISLHPTGRSSSREFGDEEWLGFVMEQSPYWHRDIQRDRSFNKPVVNGEYGYAGYNPDDDIRIGAWEIVTAGGFFTAGFFSTFAPDKGGWDLDANPQQQKELKWLFSFMDNTEWWKMEPHDELVNNGYCIAIPGQEYLAYSRDGGSVSVDLSGASGTLPMEWFNPREGTYSAKLQVNGGSSVNLDPPFAGDWVLHIGRTNNQDLTAPAAPTGLVLEQN